MEKEKKEDKEIEPSIKLNPVVISEGCNQHEYKEDYFDERSGWVHAQCKNCSMGRYFKPLTHKIVNGEIIEKRFIKE